MAVDTLRQECDERTGEYRENGAGKDRDPLQNSPRFQSPSHRGISSYGLIEEFLSHLAYSFSPLLIGAARDERVQRVLAQALGDHDRDAFLQTFYGGKGEWAVAGGQPGLFTHDEMETWGLGVPGDTLGGCTTYLGMMDHVGTHIDAFVHTKRGGATIDEMPLDLFMGKAVCLDLRHIPDLGDIDVKDLEEAEKKSGVKIDGHIVLICTGLHERHFPRESVVHSNAG